MRNDRDLLPGFARGARCQMFLPCVYADLQQLYPIKQMPINGSYDIGERGRAVG